MRLVKLSAILLAASVLMSIGCVPAHRHRTNGVEALRSGNLERAQREFDAAEAKDPEHWETQYLRGLLALRKDQPSEARILLERSYALAPDQPQTPRILDALARALFQSGDTAALVSLLNQTATQRATSPDFLRKAEYLARIGDPDGAVVAYRTAVRLSPGDPAVYEALIGYYESINNTAGAIRALRQLHGLRPEDPGVAERLRAYGIVPGPAASLPPGE